MSTPIETLTRSHTETKTPDRENFARRLAEWLIEPPKRGEYRTGTVLQVDDTGWLVDVGAKRDAIIPASDLRQVASEVLDEISVGDELPLRVIQPRNRDDDLIVSLRGGLEHQSWQRAVERMDDGTVLSSTIVGHNRGGLLVRVDGLEAFLPNSLCSQLPRGNANDLARAKAELVGQSMPVKVIEVNTDRRRLVVSEKAARREARDQLLADIRPGMVRTGAVTGLTDFGAFVDIGGADGLVHISELAWQFVDHPSEVLKVGDEIEVEVLSVDIERSRIGLSRKRCLPEPWVGVEERYQVGQVVAGRVKARTGVGLIVVLADGVEGLVRPEDLKPAEATDPQAVGQPGQWASLRVQGLDHAERRLRLSLELPVKEN